MFVLCFNRKKLFVAESLIKILTLLTVTLSIGAGYILRSFSTEILTNAVENRDFENIIVLDAGHGGEDCGAIGTNGVYEKDLNLSITFLIGELLAEKGYTVIFTRTDDRLLYRKDQDIKGIRKISDLKNRVEIVNKYPESTFVSIHMNSFPEEKYSGLQVYYSTQNKDSFLLANAVQSNVSSTLQPQNSRKVKPGADIYVLKNVDNPSILIECGFLSNKTECENLSKKEYQKRLSFSIFCGIIEYEEQLKKK